MLLRWFQSTRHYFQHKLYFLIVVCIREREREHSRDNYSAGNQGPSTVPSLNPISDEIIYIASHSSPPSTDSAFQARVRLLTSFNNFPRSSSKVACASNYIRSLTKRCFTPLRLIWRTGCMQLIVLVKHQELITCTHAQRRRQVFS